jgi:hypothetical protein
MRQEEASGAGILAWAARQIGENLDEMGLEALIVACSYGHFPA